jgi:uncharacterized protein
MNMLKIFYLGFAWICVGLGFIGIILPIFPTTPFLLVAVWAFSRSSPEMAEKLRNHPKVGRFIRDWQDHGAIPMVGKVLAIAMMTATGVYLAGFSELPSWAALSACAILAAVGVYILTRPSSPPHKLS